MEKRSRGGKTKKKKPLVFNSTETKKTKKTRARRREERAGLWSWGSGRVWEKLGFPGGHFKGNQKEVEKGGIGPKSPPTTHHKNESNFPQHKSLA